VSLTPGTRLGAYEIVAPLGAGGMGEVYRARDTRLSRSVAIKVLPAELASDRDRLGRFLREARAASSLNHPHIVTVHESGEEEGFPFLVMELVDGSSLRELLLAGPLPLRKALAVAAQVADGLAKAHEAGLVHRDLKPENLMVTRDGYAKVLDFGLAKEAPKSEPDASRALTVGSTETGTIVGTVGYMSPEQAAGRPVDFRSDLFAFGCVLYEMLCGRRAFDEPTAVDTLSAILHREPEPLPESVPQPVRWVVERCLAKEPGERYAATRDLARDLAQLREVRSASGDAAPLAPRPHRRVVAAIAALTALAVVAGAFFLGRSLAPRGRPSFRMLSHRRGTVWSGRFVPGAGSIVYGAAWDGDPVALFTTSDKGRHEFRALEYGQADVFAVSRTGELALALHRRPLQGAETTATLARASLAGGAPRELLEDVRAADFLPDGADLLVVREENGGVRLGRLSGGQPLYVTQGWIGFVRVSPSGKLAALLEHPVRRDNRGHLVILELATGRVLVKTEDWPIVEGLAWSADEKEVWMTPGWSVYAADLAGRVRRVATYPAYVRMLDIDSAGRVLLAHELANWSIAGLFAGEPRQHELSWLDQSYAADIAVDGRSLLFTEYSVGDSYGVFYRKAGQPAVSLGEGAAMSLSPDGRTALAILFGEPPALTLLPTGAGTPRTLPPGPIATYVNASFFPDGQRVLFWGAEKGRGLRYWVQDLAGGGPRAVTPEGVTVQHDGNPISPDGRYAAAVLDGKLSLYPVDGGQPVPVAGVEPGEQPIRFHPDGRLYLAKLVTPPPVRVHLVDPRSGARTLYRELAPDNLTGVAGLFNLVLAPDGNAYALSYARKFSTVYLTSSLR